MIQTVRNVVLVLLLVTAAIASWMIGNFSDVAALSDPHVLLAALTAVATLLFSGRRRLMWVLAPTTIVIAASLFRELGGDWPIYLREDDRVGTNWQELREPAFTAATLLLETLAVYGLLRLAQAAAVRLQRRHAAWLAKAASTARASLRIIALAAVSLAAIGWLCTYTDAYQIMQIRRDAVQYADINSAWQQLAVELDAREVLRIDEVRSIGTFAALAAAPGADGVGYRRRAAALADAECARYMPACRQQVAELRQAGWSSEADAVLAKHDQCKAPINADDPLQAAAVAIRHCSTAAQHDKALEIWTVALEIPVVAGKSPDRSRDRAQLLETIPRDASLPPDVYVFGLLTGPPDRIAGERARRAGALFKGLLAAGRWKDALSWLEQQDAALLRTHNFLSDVGNDVNPDADTLKAVMTTVRKAFPDKADNWVLDAWMESLSRLLASANDPDAALSTLQNNDSKAAEEIVEAYIRRGDLERAWAVADDAAQSRTDRSVLGRVCAEMARQGRMDRRCTEPGKLEGRDRAWVLALAGATMLTNGQRSAGVALLDRAEGAAELGDGGRDAGMIEIVRILVHHGRLRKARLLAEHISNSEGRVAALQEVSHAVVGWRRDAGIAVAKVADRMKNFWSSE